MSLRSSYPLFLPLILLGCFEDPGSSMITTTGGTEVGDGDGDGDVTGDGDGEPTGDGDGEPTGDGDGDGEPTGDGDGEPTGDGDGEPAPCSQGPYAVAYSGPIMLEAGANPRGVTVGDLDGDGHLDVLGASRSDQQLRAYLGSGTGTFSGPVFTDIPNALPNKLQLGAIADGVLDVVFTAYFNNANVFVRMRGDGNGGFYALQTIPSTSTAFALGRVTGNAALDLIAPAYQKLIVYKASIGQENYFPVNSIESNAPYDYVDAITLADFDDDGVLDVAVAGPGNVYIGKNNGLGEFTFGATPLPYFGAAHAIAAGDVTGNGTIDLVLVTAGGGSDAGHVFRGVGDGSFMPGIEITAPTAPNDIAIADIDRDGIDDLAIVGSSVIAVYLSTGDGFGPAKQITCMGQNPMQLAIGDFNGDCVGDVAAMTESGVCIMMSDSP